MSKLTKMIHTTYERIMGIQRISGTELDRNYSHMISIGDNFIGSIGSRIICHDASYRNREGKEARYGISPVMIGNNVFLGANALILMGCVIGNNVVVGAGTLLPPFTTIPDNEVWVGIPAKRICPVDEYWAKAESRGLTVEITELPTNKKVSQPSKPLGITGSD